MVHNSIKQQLLSIGTRAIVMVQIKVKPTGEVRETVLDASRAESLEFSPLESKSFWQFGK